MARKKGTEPNVVSLTPGSVGKVVITESHPGRYVRDPRVDGPLGSPAPGRFVCKDCSRDHCICNLAPRVESHGQNPDTADLKFVAHLQPVQLSSASNEHYTPSDIVERARRLMGSIDLDPASCAEANAIVKAAQYMTLADPSMPGGRPVDGLSARPWKGNVFLNPPGGVFKVLNKSFSNAALWWAALVQDWLSGDVKEAVFIGFTLEILRHSQNGCPLPVQAFHRCYPKKRLKFSGAQQPTHANVIVYLPPVDSSLRRNEHGFANPKVSSAHFDAFAREFGSLGYCEP
jgi:hypothetical protein